MRLLFLPHRQGRAQPQEIVLQAQPGQIEPMTDKQMAIEIRTRC